MSEVIVNLSEPREKNQILSRLRELTGIYRISIVQHRPRRSDRQNRYYWPSFVQPFGEWIREMGDDWTDEQAHVHLRKQFLTKSIVNKATGEVLETVISTTDLSTVEFNDYLDKCAGYLANLCEIVVPEPLIYREKKDATT